MKKIALFGLTLGAGAILACLCVVALIDRALSDIDVSPEY